MKKFIYTEVMNADYYSTVMYRDEANIIIRLADLYLMKAEAWNEYLAVPDEVHVYAPLDEVRKRAGIPGVDSVKNSAKRRCVRKVKSLQAKTVKLSIPRKA